MAAKAITSLFGTGYKVNKAITNEAVVADCAKFGINTDFLKRTIISSLMGNIVIASQGPEKIAALLWE